ncbi:SCO family protein [Polaribacter sp. L3A8]|uniref:SCO family protein n=1 Tax=Polaribacter sp. L3A8 TaxID=2686361 RepID=UPI0018EF264A|nr:SCO family protein [Polaribacter sp. L3A8]
MKTLKYVLLLVVTVTLLVSCDKKIAKKTDKVTYQCPMKCEGDKVYSEKGNCPVCEMKLMPTSKVATKILSSFISEESIFNLTTKWNRQDGKEIELKELKGKTLVMVMIYTTCKAACPRLTADMRNIEDKIPTDLKNEVEFVLVSIDPVNDTPKKLKAFAKENFLDRQQWTLLQGTESGVREFANVLAVKYKQISPLDFSHSNIISVFNPGGELVHQQEGLGVDNKETIKKIIEIINTH